MPIYPDPGNRKNMLLDITVSPCSRVTMFFYMLMQITARLLGRTLIHHHIISDSFKGTVS
jgi:hypothetical protein